MFGIGITFFNQILHMTPSSNLTLEVVQLIHNYDYMYILVYIITISST